LPEGQQRSATEDIHERLYQLARLDDERRQKENNKAFRQLYPFAIAKAENESKQNTPKHSQHEFV
jgi:septin family protein